MGSPDEDVAAVDVLTLNTQVNSGSEVNVKSPAC